MRDLYTYKARKTLYEGAWYDSFNEARWAALFDLLGFVHKKPTVTGSWDPDFGFRTDCRKVVYAEAKLYCARHGWPEPHCRWLESIYRKLADAVDGEICDEVIAIGNLSRTHRMLPEVSPQADDEPAIIGLRLKSTKSHTGILNSDYWEPVHVYLDRHGRYVYQGTEEYRNMLRKERVLKNPLTQKNFLMLWDRTYDMVGVEDANTRIRKRFDFNISKKPAVKFI
ncbi:hypothetical protein [Methylobacterium sp. 1030]|uniref:hypothetical protein n=1 Tax=Methylobacterium sp. 1030 TaxID=3156404 RepID=UPI003394B949